MSGNRGLCTCQSKGGGDFAVAVGVPATYDAVEEDVKIGIDKAKAYQWLAAA